MDIEADSIRAINDAFRVTRADGSVDPDASAALVAQLKESLGLNYTEGTVADDIHTRFIKEKKGFGIIGQIVAMVAAVAISIVTAGAGAALMGVALAEMSVMQAALAVAIDGLIAGTLSSMVSQVITTGSLNIGTALKAGAVSGLTAGLTQGALGAMNLSNAGIGSIGDNLAKGNWTQAAGQLGSYAQATVVRSAISAGINTAVYGGSFGQAFAGGLVRDAAALAANAVGVSAPGIGAPGADAQSILANALGHALVGCAAQSLSGGDCAGGAIGGAASAIAAPLIRDQVYADSPVLNYSDDPVRQALTVGMATLIGGATGALLGTDATAAALAAQNESLNNATSGVKKPVIPDDVRKMMEAERRAFGQTGSVPNSGGSDGPAMVGPSPLVLGGAKSGVRSGVPGNDFTPNPDIAAPYSRPSGAGPTAAQRAAVQGQPCVDCGAITANQVADHKDPLVVQYYRDGSVNVPAQRAVDAVQPHCPTCSASQGGQLGVFGKAMRDFFGF